MSDLVTQEQSPKLSKHLEKILDAGVEIYENRQATDIMFMARTLVQATLPHSDPGDVPIWGRKNGHLTLTIKPDWEFDKKTNEMKCVGVPYGTIPRLLLFWIITEAVRKKSRRIELGDSLSEFMRQLHLVPTGGRWGTIPRLREQMKRLFRAKISFDIDTSHDGMHGHAWYDMQVAPKGELWWNYKNPEQDSLWKSWIELGDDFYNAICASPVPVDVRALFALKNSALTLDLYTWATYKSYALRFSKKKEQFIPWRAFMQQLGADYANVKDFKRKAKVAFKKVYVVYPDLDLQEVPGGFIIRASNPAVTYNKK